MDKIDFEYKINSKDYNEPFAKELLTIAINKNLKKSKNKDKPDIWSPDNKYGIEITTLADTYRNTLNRYKRIWAKKELTLEQIAKGQPSLLRGKLGINKYGNLILLNSSEAKRTVEKSQKDIATTVAMKLQKLQNYKIFERNDLFIFAPNLHGACSPAKIQQSLSNIEKLSNIRLGNLDYSYNNIFVYTYTELIYIPFTDTGVMQVIPISEEIRNDCDKMASKKSEIAQKKREQKKLAKHHSQAEFEME